MEFWLKMDRVMQKSWNFEIGANKLLILMNLHRYVYVIKDIMEFISPPGSFS